MANISELQLPDGTIKTIEDGTLWSGHRAAWEALTTEEQSKYKYVMLDDDSETGETVDAVTDGDMRAVTSNAVFDAISDRLQHIHIDIAYDKTCTITIPSSSIGAIFTSGSRADKCGLMQFYSYNASAQVMWYGTQPTGATITPDLENHQITFGNDVYTGSLAIDIICFVKTPTYIVS